MAKRRYPNNGMVDEWGRLTVLARQELESFRHKYRKPIRYLLSKFPRQARAVLDLIEAKRMTMDEFEQTVWTEAVKGVMLYDQDFGTTVTTHLCHRIRSAASAVIREYGFRQYGRSLDDRCGEGGDRTLSDVTMRASTTDHPDREIEPWGQFTDRLRRLTPIQRTVIHKRYADNLTLLQVGDELGVTRERVRQIEQEALARIRCDSPAGERHRCKTHVEFRERRRAYEALRQQRFREQFGTHCTRCKSNLIAYPSGLCRRCHIKTRGKPTFKQPC